MKKYKLSSFTVIFLLLAINTLNAVENWNVWHLGPIGIMGKVEKGSPVFKIVTVNKDTPGARAGLLPEDLIIAVNGKKFETTTFIPQDGGKGPLEALGYAIDKAEGANGVLNLTITRNVKNNSQKELTKRIQLEVIGSFSSTYPYNCKKSRKFLEQCCKQICREASSSRTTVMALSGLALLAADPIKYNKTIKEIRDTLLMRVDSFKNAYNWTPGYVGVFLAEYYMTHKKDQQVFKAMEVLVRLTEPRIMATGSFGYGNLDTNMRGRPVNSAGTTVCWFWALAKRCGVKIDEDRFHLATIHLVACTRGDGGVRYNWSAGGYDNGSKTANTAIALSIIGKDALKKLALRKAAVIHKNNYTWPEIEPGRDVLGKASRDMKKRDIVGSNTDYLINNLKLARENHVTMSLGMLAIPAAFAINKDKKKLRVWMDYWRWFLRLSIGPGNEIYYHGNNQSHMGDRQLGQDRIAPIVYALILAVGQKNLQSHGNENQARLEPTYAYLYQKGSAIDRKAGLKAFFHDKMPEILDDIRELKEAFDLFKMEQDNPEGEVLLKELTTSINSHLEHLRKLILIKPLKTYKQLKIYESVFSKEQTFNTQLKSILSQSKSSLISSYLRIEKEHEKILKSTHITDKSFSLKRILKKYKNLLNNRHLSPEMRYEVEESIASLQSVLLEPLQKSN